MFNKFDQSLEIKDEDKILLLSARTQINNKTKSEIKKLLTKDLDWDYLIERSYLHKLTPLLYRNLKEFEESSS